MIVARFTDFNLVHQTVFPTEEENYLFQGCSAQLSSTIDFDDRRRIEKNSYL
jgi:hypothetical protein